MKKAMFIGGGIVVLGLAAAAAVVMPNRLFRADLERVLAELPDGTTGRFDDATYTLWDRRGTITGLEIDGPNVPYRARAERIVIDDPNLDLGDALAAAMDDPESVDAATPLPVADVITVTGLTLTTTGRTEASAARVAYGVERFEVNDLRLYPKALLQADVAGLAEALAALESLPDSMAQEDIVERLTPVLETYAALYLGYGHAAFGIGPLTAKAVVDPGEAADSPGPAALTMSIERISGTGFDRGVFGPVTAEGLRQTLENGFDCGIARIDLAEASVRPAAERLLAGEALSRSMLDGIAFGGYRVSGVACSGQGGGAFTLDSFALGPVRFAGGLPTTGSIALDRLHLTEALVSEEAAGTPLEAFGPATATVSVGAAFEWDVAGGRIDIDNLRLAVEELGHLEMQMTLADVPEDPEAMPAAKLAGARIHYRDASLVGRTFALQAKQQGLSPEAFRQEFVYTVGREMSAQRIPPEIVEPLMAFLREPTSLTITIAPPEPLPVERLANAQTIPPPRLIELLGVAVTAGE